MTDPRIAMRATYARWVRVRANVRVLRASLTAAEHGLQRDARRANDHDLRMLANQLACERDSLDTLASDLDKRIADVKAACTTIEAGYLEVIQAAARSRT